MRRLVNIIYGMMKNKTEYVHPYLPKKLPDDRIAIVKRVPKQVRIILLY